MPGWRSFRDVMTETHFMRYWRYACIPGIFGGVEEAELDENGRTAVFNALQVLLEACVRTWQDHWNPGTYICVDESMIFWRGGGEVLVLYQPRKPTEYGIEMKTAACAESSLCLHAELTEGKVRDAEKEYRDQVGQSTAVTLRLTKLWAGSGRVVIADSFYGSCQTAEWLMDELGLYCILAVKTGHRGFPKQRLIQQVQGARFTKAFMKVDVELEVGRTTFFAGGFMDKRPLLLVGSCGTSIDAEEVTRDRREWMDGSFRTSRYRVRQPVMHDTYRRNFNAVDLFNRDCFGEHSLQMTVKTRSWHRRYFLALLGMCETNAMKAYRHQVKHITRWDWLVLLSDKLINNPYLEQEASSSGEGSSGAADDRPGPSRRRECGN